MARVLHEFDLSLLVFSVELGNNELGPKVVAEASLVEGNEKGEEWELGQLQSKVGVLFIVLHELLGLKLLIEYKAQVL